MSHRLTRSPAVAALLLVATTGSAIADGEQSRETSATFGLAVSSGNTDSERYNASIKTLASSDRHRYSLAIEANRGETEGVEDVNNSRASAAYDRLFQSPWYINTHLSWAQDRQSDLYARYVAGVGAGYQFFDDERTRLSAELGPSYLSERSLESRERQTELAARWALDLRHYVLDGAVRLFHSHEWVVVLDDSDYWFATTRTGARVPVYEQTSVSLQINYDYDNQTTAESHYDSTVLATVTYDW